MPTTRNSRGREKTPVFSNENLHLERVIGSTTKSNVSFAVHPTKSEFASVAGCVTIISALTEAGYVQEHFLQSGINTATCVAYSPDGKYLAVGEKGKDPKVNIWNLSGEAPKLAKCLTLHRFGLATLAFSESGEQLVTCGVQHDGMCYVWDVSSFVSAKAPEPKASVRVSVVIHGVAFYGESSFVTVGKRHLKFWFVETTDDGKVSVEGRTAVLGSHRSATFVQVEVLGELCLAITDDGHLCSVAKHGATAGKPRFQISNFIDLQAGHCFSLSVTEKYAVCGCSDGTLAVLDRESLEHVADMPRPAPLGATLGEDAVKAVFPDAVATRMTADSSHLAAYFSDGSYRLWQLEAMPKATLVHESTSHSQAVWDVQVHPAGDSFVTCSADNTIRFWNMAEVFSIGTDSSVTAKTASKKEQIGVIHTDPTFKQLLAEGAAAAEDSANGAIGGVRCVCFAPDMEHIASGDRAGNVRVHHMPTLEQVHYAAAHDSEVLSLSYCEAVQGVSGQLLATGSRDRLIHIFREGGAENYELASTLDDHSSSITKVKFVTNEATGDVSLLSCSADKSLVFRSVAAAEGTGSLAVDRYCNSQASGTIYDMDIDTRTNSVVFSGKDKKLSTHSIVSGKANHPAQKTKKSTGDILKLALDASGQFAATSSTDKGVRLYDLAANAGKRSAPAACLAEAFATAEIMPALAVVPSSSHVLTVSGGGCIFIWKIADAVRERMQTAMGAGPLEAALAAMVEGRASLAAKDTAHDEPAPTTNAASVFEQFVADSDLPSWAQGAAGSEAKEATSSFGVAAPASGSKWAIEGGAMSLFSGESIGAPGGHDFASIFGNGNVSDDRRLTIEPSQISDMEAAKEEEEAEAEEAAAAPAPEEAPEEENALEQAITEVDSEFVNFQAFSSFGGGGMAKPRLSLSAAYRSEQAAPASASPKVATEENTVEEATTEEATVEETVDEATVDEEAISEEVIAEEIVAEEIVAEEIVAEETVAEEEAVVESATETAAEVQEVEEELAQEPTDGEALDSTQQRLQELDELLDQQRTALELISGICEGQSYSAEDMRPRAIGDEELELLEEVEVDESAEYLAKENEEKANFAYEVERTRRRLAELGVDCSAPAEREKKSPSQRAPAFRRTPLKRLARLNTLATPRSATRRDHEHVLANLRNAFNSAVKYYATLNTAVAEDMYVAEMGSSAVLEDYESLFLEMDQKMPVKAAAEPIFATEDGDEVPAKAIEVDQFPDMLVQLAEMLRTQRIA
mmetsp:Transcript_8234/g.34566  ORF Transcript_8234/g.34566 Transcript_8234/m.34566 type:complete len:1256 (-) Transcript_8234:111-3878(-)